MACSSLKGKISDMKVIADFESRPHKAVTLVVERGKARNGTSNNCQKRYLGKVEEDYQEEAQKRKVGKKDEGSEERRVRNEIIKEVIKVIQKMDVDKSVENEGKTSERQDFMQRWDCSQVDNEEEEASWQAGKKATKWQNNGTRSNAWKK